MIPPEKFRNFYKFNKGIEWAAKYYMNNPLVVIPNTSFNYSTFGFCMAGLVLEKAAGASFEDLVEDLILRNNNLKIFPDKFWLAQFRPDRAKGYKKNYILS